jgi:RND family efflux transporter MFP subunit
LGLTNVALALSLTACEEEQVELMDNTRSIKPFTISERSSGQLRRFPGLVKAVDTSRISFEVDGNTREVSVNVGDRVEKGQVLATLDDKPYQLDVEAAEADLGKANARLAEKDTDFVRQKTLFEKDWVAKAAYDQALAARDSTANQVLYATSKLKLARRDLEKTVLEAPFDGVIADKFVDPFQEVARGEPMFELYVEAAMEIEVSLPETEVGKVYLGQPAKIAFPAEGVPVQEGQVSEIGTATSEANAFPVKVLLSDPPESVLPGMVGDVALVASVEGDNVPYLIPVGAIAAGKEPGKGYVFVYDAETSTVKKVEIRTKGVQDNRVLITQGIESGDVIASTGVSFLRDGQEVRLFSERDQQQERSGDALNW